MKAIKITAISLLLFNALGALPAGVLFMLDPSGAKMGMNTGHLAHSPFDTFLIPGIVLFIANGLMSVLAVVLILKKYRFYSYFTMLQGCILIGWIIIQVGMLQFVDTLHYIMGTTGILLFVTGYLLTKLEANKRS